MIDIIRHHRDPRSLGTTIPGDGILSKIVPNGKNDDVKYTVRHKK